MDRPESLQVGPTLFTIHWDQTSWDAMASEAGEEAIGLVGRTEAGPGCIWIKPGISIDEQVDTLVHEALHAIWHVSGSDLYNTKDVVNLEEYLTQRQTPWLVMLLRDNPKFTAFVVEPRRA